MFWYVLKLLILLPMIGLMIWGSLKLAQRMQGKFGAPQGGTRSVRIVETTMLSPTMRLAVLVFIPGVRVAFVAFDDMLDRCVAHLATRWRRKDEHV